MKSSSVSAIGRPPDEPPQRILYYCPCTLGGIPDYAFEQATALAALGIDVTFMTAPSVAVPRGPVTTTQQLEDESQLIGGPRVLRWLRRLMLIRRNLASLRKYVEAHNHRYVLMSSYIEYGAPFWAGSLRALTRRGVRFGTILHDPVRNYVVGPHWFHAWSVRSGYSFLSNAFVHEDLDRKSVFVPEHIRLTTVPHGPYEFPDSAESGAQLRERLGIPAEARLLLSFGHIRDGKNLDLIIRSLRYFENCWVLVAGKEAGGLHKPVSFYQQLAVECGVSERCRWSIDHISPGHVASYFNAADVIMLTYSHQFRSASGVLNTAVHFHKPCVASSGSGPLRTQVERYHLGVWVEPDSEEAIREGLRAWLGGLPPPQWSDYLKDNSWRRNAEIVMQRLLHAHEQ